ncbi:MAG: hypothetical protein RR898_06120 [Clostridium sp.]|uniref:anti-sigma-I factor RsgI family protein n=1 Tax=Clostridium sp. TaxID=1506 RepID=UPI002FC72DA2
MLYKGLVLEIKKDYALVMKDNGTIVKIGIKNGLSEGSTIFFLAEDVLSSGNINSGHKKSKITRIITPLIALAALIMICITPLLKNAFNTTSYGIITIDINPSISIEIDKEYTITKVSGLNDDGKALNIDNIKGKPLQEGINIIKSKVLSSKTITNKDSVIIGFAFLGDETDKTFEDKLKASLKEEFKGFEVIYIKGDKSTLKKAEGKGVSLGKYKALQTLKGNVTEEDLEKMRVDELVKLLKDYSKTPGANKDLIDDIKDELEDREEDALSDNVNKGEKPLKKPTTIKPSKDDSDEDTDSDSDSDSGGSSDDGKVDSNDNDTDSSDDTGSDNTNNDDSNNDSPSDDSDSD